MSSVSEPGSSASLQRSPVGDVGRKFIVCGDNPLAFRLVEELSSRYRADVTVILADARANQGPLIKKLRRVRVIEAPLMGADVFREAGLTTADAVALVASDDVGNVYAALAAQEICPGVRLVLRIFNSALGQRFVQLFEDAQVLSDVEIATPAFVSAALGIVDPTVVRIGAHLAKVTALADADPRQVLCGIAATTAAGGLILLPDDPATADLVLTLDDTIRDEHHVPGALHGTATHGHRGGRGRWSRPRITARPHVPEPPPVSANGRTRPGLRLRFHNIRRALGGTSAGPLISPGIRWALLALGTIVTAGVGLFRFVDPHVTFWQSIYLMLFTSVGAGNADLHQSLPEQIIQTAVTLAGVAMLPLASAAIVQASVHARLALPPGALVAPERDHVVLVGLGNVGTRVLRALHERGVEAVAIDHSDNPYGAQYVKEKRIHFIQGDASRDSTLRRANVASAAALVVLTSDDVTNLEYALQGRRLQDRLRVVLRLFDGDFAERIGRTFDITVSRSVSFLAAPTFAAAMVGREVIGTIPVRRRVLLVAEVTVVAGSPLAGQVVADVRDAGEARVLAITDGATSETVFTPDGTRHVAIGDRLIVVATRAGLSAVIAACTAPLGGPVVQFSAPTVPH